MNKSFIKENLKIENCLRFIKFIYILMIMFYVGTFFTERLKFGILFWGFSIIIFALKAIKGDYEHLNKWLKNNGKIFKTLLYIGIVIVITSTTYFLKEYDLLIYLRAGSSNQVDLIFGFFALVILILSVYLYSGFNIVLITLIAIAYALFGSYLPGIFYFRGFSVDRLINITTVELLRGIFGNLLQLGGTLIAIFIIFASIVKHLGAFNFVIKFSLELAKISKKLITQSAVITSLIMGMFTGSGVANVAATGSFTIPLMKKYNVPGSTAAAIEAVASAGGQLMPPVMGTVAFLMSEYLAIPYFQIIVYGILPALLFYIGISSSVFHISGTIDFKTPSDLSKDLYSKSLDYKNKAGILIDGIPLFIALIVLIYLLAIVKYEALLCGYYTIIITILVVFVKDTITNRKITLSSIKIFLGNIFKAIDESADTIMQVALILSCMDIVVVILSSTGLSMKIGMQILSLGGQEKIYLLILSAIICIVLGCVVSSIAVYVLVVITVIPALLRVGGIEPIIAHFYVFWFAMVGLITPPIAGNVVIAHRIANAGFFETGIKAVKIGASLFILPIAMIVHPELLLHDKNTIFVFIIISVAIISFSTSFFGRYLLKGISGAIIRLVLFFISIGLIVIPNYIFIKSIIAVGLIFFHFILYAKSKKKLKIMNAINSLVILGE